MSRDTADKVISRQGTLPYRTRSQSAGPRSRLTAVGSPEFISSPLTRYQAKSGSMEEFKEPKSLLEQITDLELQVAYLVENYRTIDKWHLCYLDTYKTYMKRIDKLLTKCPKDEKLLALKKQLHEEKESMKKHAEDTQPHPGGAEALPTEDGQDDRATRPPSAQSTPLRPRESGQVHISNRVDGVRLHSETEPNFADLAIESELLKTIEHCQKGIENPKDNFSKIVVSTSKLCITQQHSLRCIKDNISELNKNIASLSESTKSTLNMVEKSVTALNKTLELAVNSEISARNDIYKRLGNLEAGNKSDTIPPNRSSTPAPSIPDPREAPPYTSGDHMGDEAQSSHLDISNTTTGAEARQVLMEASIRDFMSTMKVTLAIEIDDTMSDMLLSECMLKKVPILKQEVKDLNKALFDYLGLDMQHNTRLVKVASIILRDAKDWISWVSEKYNAEEIYRTNTNVQKENIVKLPKFEPEGEINIFEFLQKFERKYRGLGSSGEKAEKLYDEFLPDVIKVKAEPFKNTFTELRSFLLKKYGSLSFQLENTLKNIEKKSKKCTENPTDRLALFTKILLLLNKLESTKSFLAIPETIWEAQVYSTLTMNRLVDCLTTTEWIRFSDRLTTAGQDTEEIVGKTSYLLFKAHCTFLINSLGRQPNKAQNPTVNTFVPVGRGPSPTPSGKNVSPNERWEKRKSDFDSTGQRKPFTRDSFQNSGEKSPEKRRERETYFRESPESEKEKEKRNFSENSSQEKFFGRYPGKNYDRNTRKKSGFTPRKMQDEKNVHFEKLCPYRGHSHILAKCNRFWNLNSKEKRDLSSFFYCYKCLGDYDKCRSSCKGKVPEQLLCDCNINYIFCLRGHEPEVSGENLVRLLRDLVPGLEPSWITRDTTQINAATLPKVTKVDSKLQGSPILVNTRSGKQVHHSENKVIEEKSLNTCLLSQWIRIGDKTVQIFYDSGATSSLISTDLIDSDEVELVNADSISLSIIGGNKIDKTQGTYRVTLGPTESGHFYELYATGIGRITSDFPCYPVSDIKAELKLNYPEFDADLPEIVGGGPISLLVGLKDPTTHPQLLFTLPSGIGVYKSKFEDIYGSRICLGGSHPSFNVTDSSSANMINFLNEIKNLRKNDFDIVESLPDIFPLTMRNIVVHKLGSDMLSEFPSNTKEVPCTEFSSNWNDLLNNEQVCDKDTLLNCNGEKNQNVSNDISESNCSREDASSRYLGDSGEKSLISESPPFLSSDCNLTETRENFSEAKCEGKQDSNCNLTSSLGENLNSSLPEIIISSVTSSEKSENYDFDKNEEVGSNLETFQSSISENILENMPINDCDNLCVRKTESSVTSTKSNLDSESLYSPINRNNVVLDDNDFSRLGKVSPDTLESKNLSQPYFSSNLNNTGDILDSLFDPRNSSSFLKKGIQHDCKHTEFACFESFNKASALPKSRSEQLKNLTELDSQALVNYRCVECSKCKACKESPRTKAISMLELIEQEVIERSVEIDKAENRVYVQLPFMKDPTEHFAEKFARFPKWKGKISNYAQALKRYLANCKKPPHIKEGIRTVFADLLERKYVIKLSEAGQKAIDAVMSSPVVHFYCWDAVIKGDSISTPVRMVVDPTCTGLNEILAKGVNCTGRIEDIILRNRGRKHVFSSDISKMYNVLHLRESAYPYSLILYRDDLVPDSEPEIYLMLRAWYGVRPTGNQAMLAIQMLKDMDERDEIAAAQLALEIDLYVDDLFTGCETEKEVDSVIEAIDHLIIKGGFKKKFACKSGSKPCEKASSDGRIVKLLGYDWDPFEDNLEISLSNLDFSPKTKRSSKKDIKKLVFDNEDDLRAHLKDLVLTKRSVLSKIAGFFDPCGFWEPLKLQMKLEFQKLSDLAWSEPLTPPQQTIWKEIFSQFFHISSLKIKRYFLPKEIDIRTPVRLLCLADAAEHAGGAVIYAGVQLPNGKYTCQVVTAKSRLLGETIPRNELLSILLLTELVHKVVLSLRCEIGEIIYITDSSIALCWCKSVSKKLKVFVANRVATIKTLISWTLSNSEIQSSTIPLYHIDGENNLADMLTKKEKFDCASVNFESEWVNGKPWMREKTSDMPLKSYESVKVPREYTDEFKRSIIESPHLLDLEYNENDSSNVDMFHSIVTAPSVQVHEQFENEKLKPKAVSSKPWLLDIIHFGWKKSLRILGYIHCFIQKVKHRLHQKKCIISENCPFCLNEVCPMNRFEKASELYIFRKESEQIISTFSPVKLKIFRLHDNILYFDGRLHEDNPIITQDLEYDIFFDRMNFSSSTYAVRPCSPVFYAYLLYVHLHLTPHSGNLRTEKVLLDKVKPIGRFSHIVAKVRADCTSCRLMSDRTVNVKMAQLPREKTVISPPFFNVQADVVFGFQGRPFTRARTTVKLYALVIVCLVTSATSILCLESLTTQEVINAILRHSCRYGLPSSIFVDNGSQLVSLQSAEFSLLDIDLQLWDSKGVRVIVSRPKAHSDRGKVEVRVKLLRNMLKKAKMANIPTLTQLQLETVFCCIANDLNNIPISRTDGSSVKSRLFEIITPNRLILGRNNFRSLYLDVKLKDSTLPSQILANNSKIFSLYFQTLIDHIHYFCGRPPGKWQVNDERQPKIGDLVSFLFDDGPITPVWRLGRVIEIDGHRIKIDYRNIVRNSDAQSKFVTRSPRDLKIIFSESEFSIQDSNYYDKILKDIQLFQSDLGPSSTPECEQGVARCEAEDTRQDSDVLVGSIRTDCLGN